MEKDLNKLEQAIINEIAMFNEKEYPIVKNQAPYLRVKSREKTGIGMYINFEYLPVNELTIVSGKNDIILSSERNLELDVLEYGLNYELNITNGKIDFLELVTNGEDWKGNYGEFKFIENERTPGVGKQSSTGLA